MATDFDHITAEQADLLRTAQLFFVASVAPDLSPGPAGQGPVNLSPKGGSPLHVLDKHRVAYLDYTGSGNETARHAALGGPVTVMAMSVDGDDAAVVRLFGHATVPPSTSPRSRTCSDRRPPRTSNCRSARRQRS
ncbi:MAG: hypothetical protein GEU80_06400 [Dehalococcoidia bacterium]|nr:hypothetical protein [Dehalococcoidia bacterium]